MNGEPTADPGATAAATDSASRRRALVLLVVLTLAWGSTWPLLSTAVHEVSVWTFRTVSVILAGVVVLGMARLRGHSLAIERRHWPRICTATFFYFVLWNIASTYAAILLPSGQAAVIGFTMPLWSALLSWAVLGERLGARLVLGVALGATAVLLLMVPSFAAYAQAPAGLALGLVAAIGWAIGTLIIKRSDIVVSALVLTGWQLLISAVPTAIGAFALGDERVQAAGFPEIDGRRGRGRGARRRHGALRRRGGGAAVARQAGEGREVARVALEALRAGR